MVLVDLHNFSSPEDLLRTKLVLPQSRSDLVPRLRLLQHLTESVEQTRLTLVSASAGFGKTTLLSSWGTALNASYPIAWISLDEGDSIPTRFWTYIITALRTLEPACGEEALALLYLPQLPAMKSILVALINSLTTLQQTIVLILDDFHLITNTAIHDEFAFFLDHLPPQMHVMIAAREDPPLPLHRLRARGLLTELHPDDLRFTKDEMKIFFQKTMRLDLASEDIAMLETRTEGWIAGLQMSALSLKGQTDAANFIASFTGSHRFIFDYLAREILDRQTSDIQNFLLHTSIIDRLTAPLCNALTGRGDGQGMLEQLELANLFLIPLDNERHWYRYHRLFAEFLQERLRLTSADLLPTLHQRASAWYEDNELPSEAIAHALHARDFRRAADLIEQVAVKTWVWSKTNILDHFLEALPDEMVNVRPQLCIYRAWMCSFTLSTTETERWLQEGEQQLHMQPQDQSTGRRSAEVEHMLGEIFAIRTLIAVKQNNIARALDCSQQANELLASTSSLHSALKYAIAHALSSLGDDEAACHCLEEGIKVSKEAGNDLYVAHSYVFLACSQMLCGQMHRAAVTCQHALRYGSTSPTGRVLLTGAAYFSMYELHYEWNNLEDAQQYIEKAIEYAKRAGDTGLELTARLALPNLLLALGQREQAFQVFEEAYQQLHIVLRDRVSMTAKENRVRFWLEAGDIASATRWARTYTFEVENERDPLYAIERMAMARVCFALGKIDEVIKLLEGPALVSKQVGRIYCMLSYRSLQALALHAQHATRQAFDIMEEILALGESEDQIRVFVDFGQPMTELLLLLYEKRQNGKRVSERFYSQEYLFKLLVALHVPITALTARPRSVPVSVREREVLRLIADGFSTKEVAQHLTISEGTAKTHIKRIYTKLAVKSRTQAIAQARMQGWL